MNETMITLQGWVGGEVALRAAGEAEVATFRVASTPRRWSRKDEQWVDGDTQWYTVNAWRSLAGNVAASLRRGDPVLVHGRLSVSTWTNSAGLEATTFEVDAQLVGHDLARGVSSFTRSSRESAAGPDEREAAGTAHEGSADDVAADQQSSEAAA